MLCICNFVSRKKVLTKKRVVEEMWSTEKVYVAKLSLVVEVILVHTLVCTNTRA